VLAAQPLAELTERVSGAAEGTSVQISIMTAILLCRRIGMATRGCTSRAAKRDPHVFLGSTAVPCRVVNTRPVSTHAPADLAQELVADSLDLFADVDFGGVEVD